MCSYEVDLVEITSANNSQFQTVPGFFLQDDPLADPAMIGAVPARFALLDSSDTRWANLGAELSRLNAAADGNTSYKVIMFGRHGQGYHNVGEEKYGTKAWDDYWSKLNGDGELTWGPDAELTTVGKDQAAAVNKLWKDEAVFGIPPPQKAYCSPMTRAMQTNVITFAGISSERTVVLEVNCREEYGEHTCDKRNTRTYITDTFPQFDIETGFTEDDELWTAESRETGEHAAARAQQVLDRIFREDTDVTFLSITAHGGIINGFLRALGRPKYPLPTGGILPVVVKATARV
ncbi:histidine phosphatase superfamily [Mycena rosella]|uniref:Histidine phosphatase superfamily n=1 Tax=Mycena rosella TaxID=1033263 RepID=A0AAD7G890_MYCRO|nr:histidine phosphatase superfamily [Mycena rosella]